MTSASENVDAVRTALGGEAFAAAWAEGEGISLDEAAARATHGTARAGPSMLTSEDGGESGDAPRVGGRQARRCAGY